MNPIGPLTILGDPEVGKRLTARPNGIKDPDGINEDTISFTWYRNGLEVPEFTGRQVYLVSHADEGADIRVMFTYEDMKGNKCDVQSKPKHVIDDTAEAVSSIYKLILGRPPRPEGARNMAARIRNEGIDVIPELCQKMIDNKKAGAT